MIPPEVIIVLCMVPGGVIVGLWIAQLVSGLWQRGTKSDCPGGPQPAVARSPEWPQLRAQHIAKQPCCQMCGAMDNCEVHHLRPYHLYPELEVCPDNLLTLCRAHHLLVGHLMSWIAWNPDVVSDAAWWRHKIAERRHDR